MLSRPPPIISHGIFRGLFAPSPAVWEFLRDFIIRSGKTTYHSRSRSEQFSAAALVFILHAGVIALLLQARSTIAAGAEPGIIAFSVPRADAPAHQHQRLPHADKHFAAAMPVVPSPLPGIDKVNFVESMPIADAAFPAAPDIVGGGCDLTAPVQAALRNDPEVLQRLAGIPSDDRSVANAIMVWNAGWIDSAVAPAQATFTAIRRAITRTVAASSADCRSQVQAGPRLIYLPAGSGNTPGRADKTIILALGSGQWSWQQLADGNQPLPAGAQAVAAPPAPWSQPSAAPATPALNRLLASLIRNRSPTALPYYP